MATRNQRIAEGVGTFCLTFSGCCVIVVNAIFGGMLGHVGVSLVFGLVVMAIIYTAGNISSAHINPDVTLGFLLADRLKRRIVLPYMLSPMLGGIITAVVLRFLFPTHETLGAPLPAGAILQAFVMEVVLSFLLIFVILQVSTGYMEKGIMTGVAIGGTVALDAFIGGPVTGDSMNPTRSFGPVLISWHFESLWIYLVVPVVGAFLAHPTCRWIQGETCCR